MKTHLFSLGGARDLDGSGASQPLLLPANHLVTHGVILGMTGSGKTGLALDTCEEALRNGVPVLMIDVKGDLANLLLAFPTFASAPLESWVAADGEGDDDRPAAAIAAELAAARAAELHYAGIDEATLGAFDRGTSIRVITPGGTGGEPLHVLSSLERRSALWDTDPESAQSSLSAAISLVLRLVGRDGDPARSREHVVLSVLAERRLKNGQDAPLDALLHDLGDPPILDIGALPIDEFLSPRDRKSLAAALNNLLASPTFAAWRTGASLDVAGWMTPTNGRTPAVIVSVAHLDDEERSLVLGVILEEVLAWTRSLPGAHALRALVMFDEVSGFLPPHPHNPPTKRPLVALMKQARAFGVGVIVATQNPMDLDYRALGNAGLWCVGRLQTDADRARVVDGLAIAGGRDHESSKTLGDVIKRLAPRTFVIRDAHAEGPPILLRPRGTMSFLHGPMTRVELQRAIKERAARGGK